MPGTALQTARSSALPAIGPRRYHGGPRGTMARDRRRLGGARSVAETRAEGGAVDAARPKGSPLKLSNYLGILREDPYDADAFAGLRALAHSRDAKRLGEHPVRLLEVARGSHEQRGEPVAVARLLEVEALLVAGDTEFEASLWKELGRVRLEQLLDPEGATEAYERALALAPGDEEVAEALKRLGQAQGNWGKFAKRFVEEAETASDASAKSSLLLRAACLVWQYKKRDREKESERHFESVLELDPGNVRAAQLYEHTLREREEWEPLAKHLLASAGRVAEPKDKLGFFLRAGRVLARVIGDPGRAVGAFRAAVVLESGNEEAMSFLSGHYTAAERWDELVALYESALAVPQKLEVEQGVLLQIGMVHWRMGGRPEAAEPYFARLRKLDAAHPAMISFYREYLAARGQVEALLTVLADAQRVAADPAVKRDLALELARTAEAAPHLTDRAIEAWKLVQRIEPGHEQAGRVLKGLYTKAEKWNALVDVIKAQVEATPDAEAERKVALLRELLAIYRDRLAMDGMVINTLNAIAKLAPGDRGTLDELAEKYESMGRWNDLIALLSKEAERETDRARQVESFLRVASLWIDHFANYNQATAPLEKVIALDPENRQALVQLKDIYARKRAWKALYDVLGREKAVASDPNVRLANTVEMAKLAADRLQRHGEAIEHWKEALAIDPTLPEAIEALSKLSERERDWSTLAGALERELQHASSDEARIRTLQKLGALYHDEMNEPRRAIGAWQKLLQIDPKHGRALRSLRDLLIEVRDWDELEALYGRTGEWETLADVFGTEADKSEERDVKIELSFRAARIFEERIGAPERAVRSYERVFTVDAKNMRAANALAAIYEREEKWARLRGVLDLMLGVLPGGARDERLALLERLGALAKERLRDGEAAFGYAVAAYRLRPESEQTRARLEATAEAAAAYDRVVALYRERAEVAPAAEAQEVRRRIASLCADRLGDAQAAAAQYEELLDRDPSDADALVALERIYRAAQRLEPLHGVLVRKLKRAVDPGARWACLKELASIEETALGKPEAAAERYRAMAAIDPADREVLSALDRLALAGERWDELAKVLARRGEVEDEATVRADLACRLGIVKLDRLDDAAGAFEVLRGALALQPTHGPTVAALERMYDGQYALAPRIGRVLEDVYSESKRYDKLVQVLQKRLQGERDDNEVRRLRLKLAEISGSMGDALGAYGALESAFFESPSDAALWDQLAETADAASQHKALANAFATAIEAGDLAPADVAELAARTARLYDDVLDSREEAEPFHRRVLAHDPLNDTSFHALKELFTASERWDELQALYRTRIEETVDSGAKLDLLLQTCFLIEEILDRPDLAVETYEQVLELDPDHVASRRALERLYQATGRWRDLAKLLRGNLDRAEGKERVELMARLGELYETKLGEPGQAVDQYEGVLVEQPTHLRAQEALARLLSVEGQRQRIATILEPLYENQGAWIDLTKVLEIQLADRDTPGARVELLTRIGQLHEQRTRDGDAAFSAYARAVEADPADGFAREALAKLATSREVYRRRRAEVLSAAVEASASSPEVQADILLELAVLLDEYLNDRVGAERAYEQLIAVDPDDADVVLQASRALERIHLAREDYAKLVQDLDRQVRFETDDRLRAQLLLRIAETYETMLEQVDGAIDAHRRRLEIDPTDQDALRALCRLYEQTERPAELVDTLKSLSEAIDDPDERRAIGCRVGALYEEKLEDTERAIEAYREVVNAFGPERGALASLAELLEQTEAWRDLLETLEQQEAIAEGPAAHAGLRFRMAEVMRLHTGEAERAIEYYEQVLRHDTAHAAALGALDAVMEGEDALLRVAAARVAAPCYEASQSHDKLFAVLEVLQQSDDPQEKLAALRRAAEVAESRLQDVGQAFESMGRAVRAGVEDDSIGALLGELERLAEGSSRWADYVALLRDAAPNILDATLQMGAHRQVASVARDRLGDNALAREYYAKVLAELPDDIDALDALERLNEEAGEHAALIDVLKRKAELTSDPRERQRLLGRQADIYERGLDDPDAAIGVLEELLVDAPEAAAYASLERLYSAAARWDDLGAMYEQQLDRGVGDLVEVRYKLARNCHQRQNDTARALEYLREALTAEIGHGPSIELLESIMGSGTAERAVAAEILESGYLTRMEWPKLTASLEVRIGAEEDIEERKRLLVRLGQIHEDQLEDFDGALGIYARLFLEDPREQEVWDTLTRLAKVGARWARLGEILAEPLAEGVEDEDMARLAMHAGRIYDDRVGDPAQAAVLYAKALRFDPSDEHVFNALEAAWRHGEAWDDLLPLYREQADAAPTDERRVELLHRRARIFRDVREDRDQAIQTYREILEIDPSNVAATEGLERLLAEAKNWEALAEHLRERVDRAVGTPEEIPLRLRLAQLHEEERGDLSAAIDVYEEITALDRREPHALQALERLVQGSEERLRLTEILEPIYQELDQWKKLVVIYEARVGLIEDEAEKVRLLGEIGTLHERRGHDAARAFRAWSRAFAGDPENEVARGHADRIAAALGAWDDLVHGYEAALEKAGDSPVRSTLLTTIARVHDEKRGDPRAAIAAYERLVAHDASDPAPLEALESLHTMVGDWAGLAGVLGRKVELAFDVAERGELLRRIGSVQEGFLSDPEAAIAAYVRAAQENDGDDAAYDALDRLYLGLQRFEALRDVLARRVEIAPERADRVAFGVRLGALCEHQLREPERAIEAYRRVLDDDAANVTATEALGGLFERGGMWPELLENLKQRASVAVTEAERVSFRHRAGEVLERELGDLYEAIQMYREALGGDAAHGPSIDALIRISRVAEFRAQAAEVVEPLLREQRRFDDLVLLLEQGLETIVDPLERRTELQHIAELHEKGRGKPRDAFDTLLRALAEDPGDDEVLGDLERLARSLGAWRDLVDALAQRAGKATDPAQAASLYRRLARIAEEEMGDDVRAIDAFVKASGHDDDASETLVHLDRLYQKTARWQDLLEVLDRRIAAAGDPEERTELLIRLGGLRVERFDDARGAFVAFNEVLEGDPADERALEGMEALGRRDELAAEVIEVLDRCYRGTGALDKVARLYDLKILLASNDAERIRLHEEAAAIWENDLGDPARALESRRRVFELDPSAMSVLDELERLAGAAGSWEGLRGMVEGLDAAGALASERRRQLNLRAADWYRDRLGDPAAEEACLRRVLEVDRELASVHERLVGLLAAPERAGDLVTALRAWAAVEPDATAAKERLREAGRLAERALSDVDTAAACYEGVLAGDAEDVQALDDLARIRDAQERHADVVALVSRRLGVERDAGSRVALRYRIAELQAQRLEDSAAAIASYQALLEEAPDEARAASELERLLAEEERWEALRDALGRRLGRAGSVPERTEIRTRLAELCERRFDDPDGAITELRKLLDEDPGCGPAVDSLDRLYTAGKHWKELVTLIERRASDAASAGDREAEMRQLLRACEVYENRLADPASAVATYRRVHALVPADAAVLGALVRLLEAADAWSDVAPYLQALLALQSGAEAVTTGYRLAEIADKRLGDFALAESALAGALSADPGRGETREKLKALYEKHQVHAKLVRLLDEEAEALADPAEKVALLGRIASIYTGKLSDPGSAVSYLERASALVPNDRDTLLALCDLYIAAGRQRDAIPVLEKIVESYGGKRAKEVAGYQHKLGQACEGLGDQEGALKHYDAAFKIDLTNARVLADLGRLSLARGDLDRAQKSYRALLLQKLGPEAGIEKADVYFYLGQISVQQGDKMKAKAMLERAVAEGAGYPAAKALLAEL